MAELRHVKRIESDTIDVIEISGPMDIHDPEVLVLTDEIIAEGKIHIIIDFTKVSYLTSAGLSCVVRVYKKLHALKGSLIIRNATEDMRDLFDLARLNSLLTFI